MVGSASLVVGSPLAGGGAVTSREFMRQLAKARRKPAPLPAPALALRLGMGEMSHMLLDSQRVVPRKLLDNEFEFRYNNRKNPDIFGTAVRACEL